MKSTIRSYLSCCLANWKRALFSLLYEIPWSPTCQPYLNPHSSKHEYSPDSAADGERGKENQKNEDESSSSLTLKDVGTCCFPFAWTLRKWSHFHTFLPFSTHCRVWFHNHPRSEAGANGYHTREVWRTLIHSQKRKKKTSKKAHRRTCWSQSYGHWRKTPRFCHALCFLR